MPQRNGLRRKYRKEEYGPGGYGRKLTPVEIRAWKQFIIDYRRDLNASKVKTIISTK